MKEIRRITLDVDFNLNKRKFIGELSLVQRLLNNLKPCEARVSSSKRGLHIQKFYEKTLYEDEERQIYQKRCMPLEWIEEIYDDPKRRMIREIRAQEDGTPNILFDTKSFRDITREAGEWYEIQDASDVELFLDFFLDFWRI
jgi:hypothetical protein